MASSRFIYLDVKEIKVETDSAFLFHIETDEGEEAIWFPKSQIADPDDYEVGDKNVEIGITEWIAKQKGFEVDE